MKVRMCLLVGMAIVVVSGTGLAGFNQAAMADGHEHNHNHSNHWSFSPLSLVKPLGICALSSLLITFLIGLFRRRLGRRFLKLHMIFAFLTIIIALSHGILVLLLF